MNVKTIENALRNYKRKKSVVETALSRIGAYKQALENPDDFITVYLTSSREPGMPRGNNAQHSITEAMTISKDQAIRKLQEWTREEQSKIYPLQLEIEQIDGALNALSYQERYIVESKYFEGMFWREIEIGFNKKFRQANYITYEGLKKMNKESLQELARILEPFYQKFGAVLKIT